MILRLPLLRCPLTSLEVPARTPGRTLCTRSQRAQPAQPNTRPGQAWQGRWEGAAQWLCQAAVPSGPGLPSGAPSSRGPAPGHGQLRSTKLPAPGLPSSALGLLALCELHVQQPFLCPHPHPSALVGPLPAAAQLSDKDQPLFPWPGVPAVWARCLSLATAPSCPALALSVPWMCKFHSFCPRAFALGGPLARTFRFLSQQTISFLRPQGEGLLQRRPPLLHLPAITSLTGPLPSHSRLPVLVSSSVFKRPPPCVSRHYQVHHP